MKQHLRQFILEKLGHEPEGIDRVLDAFQPIRTRKNEVLVEVGSVCRSCYFLAAGCLKISTYNLNGDESTTRLAFEGDWCTAMSSFLNQQPSNERIVAVETGQLLAIGFHDFRRFAEEVPGFQQIYRGLLEASYTQSIERVQTLMTLDALDRVRWLLNEQPLIFTRLSNRLIASYLGISEATLSRLKAKL